MFREASVQPKGDLVAYWFGLIGRERRAPSAERCIFGLSLAFRVWAPRLDRQP